ncbi:unnamed protein product [Amoebophrya sp. A25]|nr:unnamed protein product [Amoebophrya sp. A25]|eukprot:GSA25T00006917001.1
MGMGSHTTLNSGAISTLGMGSMSNLINRAGSFL